MLCTNCGKNNAQFHYKQIIGGSKTEQHLCTACAQALGYLGKSESFFDIGSILNDFISVPKMNTASKVSPSCEACGTTYDEFRRSGLLGCDRCYDSFGNIIESSLSQIQPSTTHKGTLGGEAGKKIERQNEIAALKEDLKKAIIDERYEDAASLRDKIKEMEEKENG